MSAPAPQPVPHPDSILIDSISLDSASLGPTRSGSNLGDRPASLNRRDWLCRAARGMAPLLFSGCGLGVPTRSQYIKVGLLHSQTGPLGQSESALRDAELFALEEINARGGLLGRQIEPVAPDTRSRSEDLYPKRARKLLVEDQVPVVFGGYSAASRRAMLPLFEEQSRLLVFPAQTEGNAASPNLVCGGALPNQQVLPALDWLLGSQGGNPSRLVFLGSEGLYSRTAHYIATKYLATRQRQFDADLFVPLQGTDWSPVLDTLAEQSAQTAVLSTLAGNSNGEFYQQLRERGLNRSGGPTVLGLRLGEDELRLLPPDAIRGQLAGATYFQSLATPDNQRFVSRFKQEFGYDRVTSDAMESAYSLVHLWALAVAKAGALNLDAVRQALRDVSFAGPGGEWRIDPATQHTTKTFHLGRARDDRQFEIIHSSAGPIPPDVFPQFAFPGWKCDLTAGGVTRGEPVDLNVPGNTPAPSAAGASTPAPPSPSAK